MILTFENKTYDTEKMTTRFLLKMLRDTYKFNLNEWDCDLGYIMKKSAELEEIRDILKTELAQREHIPNKIEAKALRIRKAMQRTNIKQRGYVNR